MGLAMFEPQKRIIKLIKDHIKRVVLSKALKCLMTLLKRWKVDDEIRDVSIQVYLLDRDTTIFTKFMKNREDVVETLVVLENQVTRNMHPISQFRGSKENDTRDNSCGSPSIEWNSLDAMRTTRYEPASSGN